MFSRSTWAWTTAAARGSVQPDQLANALSAEGYPVERVSEPVVTDTNAAAIMLSFTLGTAPLFIIVGLLAKGVDLFQTKLKYASAALTVAAGRPVRLKLRTDGVRSCTSVFRIPKLKIQKTLPATGETLVTATFPQPGRYAFSCGMGMFSGTIDAV